MKQGDTWKRLGISGFDPEYSMYESLIKVTGIAA